MLTISSRVGAVMPNKLPLTGADSVIIFVAVAGLFGLYAQYWMASEAQADYALVMVDRAAPLKIDLDRPHLVTVRGPLGENVLQVEKGKIRVIASPCKGKQCIHAGWLQVSGDFTACLPNRVSIEVHSNTEDHFDEIAY